MYGLVNRAVQGLVETTWGADAWRSICAEAKVDPVGFLAMQAYPDDVTYRLVGAASRHSGLPPDQILRAFGEYWVLYTGREGYGDLLTATGTSVDEFLGNLDNLHARVSASFPELQPPSFRIERIEPGVLHLHYHSHRAGLAPLVEGLLIGVGKLLGKEVTASVLHARADGHDHDVFLVRHA